MVQEMRGSHTKDKEVAFSPFISRIHNDANKFHVALKGNMKIMGAHALEIDLYK